MSLWLLDLLPKTGHFVHIHFEGREGSEKVRYKIVVTGDQSALVMKRISKYWLNGHVIY